MTPTEHMVRIDDDIDITCRSDGSYQICRGDTKIEIEAQPPTLCGGWGPPTAFTYDDGSKVFTFAGRIVHLPSAT